uniref:Uncharacterized protein n=1 Tax=Ditylenchus dipsaci TaxID=166011 RepID=A0A915D0T7_9BILA
MGFTRLGKVFKCVEASTSRYAYHYVERNFDDPFTLRLTDGFDEAFYQERSKKQKQNRLTDFFKPAQYIPMECLAIKNFGDEWTLVLVSFREVFFAKEQLVPTDGEHLSPSKLPYGEKKECLVILRKDNGEEFVPAIEKNKVTRHRTGYNVTVKENGIPRVMLMFSDQDRAISFKHL